MCTVIAATLSAVMLAICIWLKIKDMPGKLLYLLKMLPAPMRAKTAQSGANNVGVDAQADALGKPPTIRRSRRVYAWTTVVMLSLPLAIFTYLLVELGLPQVGAGRAIMRVHLPAQVPFAKPQDLRVNLAPVGCNGYVVGGDRNKHIQFRDSGAAEETVVPFDRMEMHLSATMYNSATGDRFPEQIFYVPIYYRLGIFAMNVTLMQPR
jgi:hypothetical protein